MIHQHPYHREQTFRKQHELTIECEAAKTMAKTRT
jgi:hypothetical protein